MAAFEVIALDTATPQLRAPGAADTYTHPRQSLFLAGTAAAPGIAGNSDDNTGMLWPAADTLAWATGGNEQMRLTGTGLGIGTSSPAGGSQLTAYGASNGQIAVQNSTNWSRLLQNSNDLYIDNGVGGSAGNIVFRNSSSTIERMRLDSSGNLGIGTSSPGHKLTVHGGINVTSSATLPAGQGSMLFSYEAPVNRIYMGDGTGYSFAFSKRVSSTTTDLVTLTDAGNLGIGTTSPARKIDIANGQIRISNSGAINPSFGTRGSGSGASGFEIGQFYNEQTFFIYDNAASLNRFSIKPAGQARFFPLSADPAGAENGDVYYNSTTNKLRVYAGGSWVDLH
jgi:hypothetical protein